MYRYIISLLLFSVIAILSTILYFNLDSFNKSLSRKERKEADIAPVSSISIVNYLTSHESITANVDNAN